MKSKTRVILAATGILALFVLAGAARLHRPNELNSGTGYDGLVISFFQKDYKGLLLGIEEELSESKIIVVAEATGKKKYVYGNLKQEIILKKIVRGSLPIAIGEKTELVGNGWREYNDKKELQISTGFINYLRKGDRYLIFCNDCVDDYSGKGKILRARQDSIAMRCLNLSREENYVCPEQGEHTRYKNVKKSEFFTNDEETLQAMVELKKRLIKRFYMD